MSDLDLIALAAAFFRRPFDGIIRIELIDEPVAIWVDGRTAPPKIGEASPPGVDRRFCLWRMDHVDAALVLTPDTRRFENSFVSGRLKISGDMAVMARLDLADG